jgi:hypothetical protein
VEWKAIYRRTVEAIAKTVGARPWSFDEAAIFAQSDAFVQRCRDLTEVHRRAELGRRRRGSLRMVAHLLWPVWIGGELLGRKEETPGSIPETRWRPLPLCTTTNIRNCQDKN